MLAKLEQGSGLTDALEGEKGVVPPMLLALSKVGEETGHLAEVFGELEKYFILQDKMRKQLRSQSMMPLIQLGLAFLILAGLIFILGMIAASNNAQPAAIFGLRGTTGTLLFLVFSFGSIGLLWFLSKSLGRLARRQARVDALLLRIPVIGPCLEALVLGRFSMALYLTLDSGMSIARALRLSLFATGNSAFTAQTETVTQAVKNGAPLVEALTRSGLFSIDFLSLVAMGEEGGRVPEVMRQQADYWNEEAANRLKIALRLASMLIWLIYAAFMIGAIFSIASIYLRALGI